MVTVTTTNENHVKLDQGLAGRKKYVTWEGRAMSWGTPLVNLSAGICGRTPFNDLGMVIASHTFSKIIIVSL